MNDDDGDIVLRPQGKGVVSQQMRGLDVGHSNALSQ